MRRSQVALEDALKRATSACGRAIALYQLAVFHDNNSREAIAIPFYEKAIRAGLTPELNAQAFSWLASSHYKTGNAKRALSRLRQARAIAKDRELRKFLDGLEVRIHHQERRLKPSPPIS